MRFFDKKRTLYLLIRNLIFFDNDCNHLSKCTIGDLFKQYLQKHKTRRMHFSKPKESGHRIESIIPASLKMKMSSFIILDFFLTNYFKI